MGGMTGKLEGKRWEKRNFFPFFCSYLIISAAGESDARFQLLSEHPAPPFIVFLRGTSNYQDISPFSWSNSSDARHLLGCSFQAIRRSAQISSAKVHTPVVESLPLKLGATDLQDSSHEFLHPYPSSLFCFCRSSSY